MKDPLGQKKIFVAGHAGMVGSAIVRALEQTGCSPIFAERKELDLANQTEVHQFLADMHCDMVIIAAAKVGGIHANNTFPADFIYENIMIEANLIQGSHLSDVQRLMFLGSSCIYPKLAKQPMNEEALLEGALEPTNEAYAIAKIAGIKLCESYRHQHGCDYRSLMPTNLYGPGDNFHPQNSHVIPALMARIHQAKVEQLPSVEIWGTGAVKREFLHVDDLADAVTHCLSMDQNSFDALAGPRRSHLNVGTGVDTTITQLANSICDVVGYQGSLIFDPSKPDGTPRKLLDTSLINSTGWQPKVDLDTGLNSTYRWFLSNEFKLRGKEKSFS